MTTENELLCRGYPHLVEFALVGFWCLLTLPFGYVVCGAGWMALWCNLKLATRYVGSGAF